MKFKTLKREVPGQYTRDGKTIPVTRTEKFQAPKLPRDWNQTGIHAALAIVLGMTLVAIAWSTYSIGVLLGGGIGFAAAVIYDVGWIVCLLLEVLSRYDKSKRDFPKRLGAILLVITMGAIFWHGMEVGNVAMGVIGAFVSAFAKLLWMGVMKHVNADLTPEDEQWIAHELSAARSEVAVASARRQAARVRQLAAMELLASEQNGYPSDVEVEVLETPKVRELAPPSLTDLTKSDAVRFVMRNSPDSDEDEVVDILNAHGVDVKKDYVRQVMSRSEAPIADVVNLHK